MSDETKMICSQGLLIDKDRLKPIEQNIDLIEGQIKSIHEALVGTLDKPGFFSKVEAHISTYERHLEVCNARFTTLENGKSGCYALSNKTIAALLTLAASVGGALVELVRYIIN